MQINLLLKSLCIKLIFIEHSTRHPELSDCITTLTVRNMEVANFCAAMDTLIDQDVYTCARTYK